MIDFDTVSFVKLAPWDPKEAITELSDLLLPDEQVLLAFKGTRDSVTFTTRRVVALNVQGLTGKKRDYSSLPYGKVNVFSIEAAGTLDRDSELELWFSEVGKVKFNFASGVDVRAIGRLIAERVL